MKLGNFLVKAGVLNRPQLDEALQHQVLHGARLGTCLVELGMLSIDTLAQQLAQFHGVQVPGRQQLEKVQPAAARKLTRALVEKRRVLPLRLDGTATLHVAMLDPHDPATLDDLRFVARARIVPYVLPELVMHDWLEWLFQVPRSLRYVDLSRSKPAPAAAREPAPKQGTLRGVGMKEAGIDMGGWASTSAAPPTQAREAQSRMAFGATLPAQHAPVGHDMADAINQVVPVAAQEPAQVTVLSVPPPRDTRPPPALVLPEVLPSPARAPGSPPPPPPPTQSRRVGGGTLPGAGSAPHDPARAATPVASMPAEASPVPAATAAAAAAAIEIAPSEPVTAVQPSERPGNVGVATWAVALEQAMLDAEDRDALVDAALRLGGLYSEAIAAFAVHRGMVQGVRALGPGGEIEGLSGILIDEATESHLTAPLASGEAARFAVAERSVEERVLEVMGRKMVREAAVFPVRLRKRTVTLIYADNGVEPLPHTCFGALRHVAEQMAAGYERLILRRRGT